MARYSQIIIEYCSLSRKCDIIHFEISFINHHLRRANRKQHLQLPSIFQRRKQRAHGALERRAHAGLPVRDAPFQGQRAVLGGGVREVAGPELEGRLLGM